VRLVQERQRVKVKFTVGICFIFFHDVANVKQIVFICRV